MTDPIRLFISDVDGTLVPQDKQLTSGVADALKRLQASGVAVSLISARPLSGIQALVKAIGIDGPVGAFNGGTIANPDGSIVSAARLKREVAERALKRFDLDWVEPWVFADGKWFAKTTEGAHVPSERITAAQEPVIVESFDDLLDRIDKIVAVSDDEPRLAKLERETQEDLGESATVARSQVYYLDVTAPEANKGVGVRAIAKAHDVPLSQVAVIGDGQNDVYMFKVAGESFAVGNASDEVKAAATHVVKPNTEDGVADAVDRYLLKSDAG
ncbi:MAG: HAD family hydrolase [Caulobacteraceae bacterium]|nr:HAD family hydrolase [Caulobacter sp.]